RSHARARAYIERARTALAEAQRESEELLQTGVAAFDRGDGDEARRLLLAAIDKGAPAEQAFAVLERLNRLEAVGTVSTGNVRVQPAAVVPARVDRARPLRRTAIWIGALGLVAAIGAYVTTFGRADTWSLLFPLDPPASAAAPPPARDLALPLPRRGEMAIARAQALPAAGRPRDALAALDGVRPMDP